MRVAAGWVVRAQRSIRDARDRSCSVFDVFRAVAVPFCRTAAEIGRGIAALSGRPGHADGIVAGRSSAAGMSGRGGFGGAQGAATDISRLRGPIQSETCLSKNV